MERLTIFRADGGGDAMLDKWKTMNEELRPIATEHGAIFQVIARDGDDVVTVNLWRSAEASEAMAADPRVLEVLKRQGFDGPPPDRTTYDVERVTFTEDVAAR